MCWAPENCPTLSLFTCNPLNSADNRNALGKKPHVVGVGGRGKEHSSPGHKLSAFCRHRMSPKGCPHACVWAVARATILKASFARRGPS